MRSEIVSDEKVEAALLWLEQNSDAGANAMARRAALEQKRKTVHAIAYAEASGTVADRNAEAYASKEFQGVTEEIQAAEYDVQIYKTKLKRAELIIEVWRTQNANNRRGHV